MSKRIREVIAQWKTKRQALLKLYYQFATPTHQEISPTIPHLATFLQDLIDYVSTLHFQILEQLLLNKPIDELLLNKINISTDAILDFDAQYTSFENIDSKKIREDLSRIGEKLEERFELEDILMREYEHFFKPQECS